MKRGLVILLLLPVACFSQKKNTKKLNLHAITSIGIAGGEKATAPVTQISAGISYGPWFSGIGVGLDYYRYNSVPVFADWRFSFGEKRILFLYVNGGYHFATEKMMEEGFVESNRLRGGFFGDGGFGFQLPAGRLHRFGLSVGYRRKTMVHTTISGSCSNCVTSLKYRYGFNTVVTKLSWEFGR